MRHAHTIALRDLRSLFVSPVAYGVLSLFAVLTGLFFILSVLSFDAAVSYYRQMGAAEALAQMNLNDGLILQFYNLVAFILLFLIPAVTMGLFVSEKTNGTVELLLTSPLTVWDIVLGKYLAGAGFVTLLVVIVGAYPALLFVYGDPELGKTLTGLLGVLLVGWTYVAVGVFASSVTRSQVVSFLVALVLLIVIMLSEAIARLGMVSGQAAIGEIFGWIAVERHSMKLMEGLVDTADLVYFGVMIGIFLLLTRGAVESVRWR